jgi:hypothetical protein
MTSAYSYQTPSFFRFTFSLRFPRIEGIGKINAFFIDKKNTTAPSSQLPTAALAVLEAAGHSHIIIA